MAVVANAKPASSAEMMLPPGSQFLSGRDDPWVYPSDGERPVREVSVDSAWVDRFAVSVF